jgi:hypothetical protein
LFASIFDIVLHEFRIGVAVVYDCCAGVLKVLFVTVVVVVVVFGFFRMSFRVHLRFL